jgi:histidyl-tRNA synthetase
MSTKIQSVRGTQDFLPNQSRLYRHIESLAWMTSQCFGYEQISTPIFEFSEVFHRSLGETSDAVSKETYDFKDRGGESLTLRPEGTAGVVRAFVNNGMAQHLPLKLFYSGPMFRYERPQKGRYRQFHQLGAEALGYESPWADVESMSLGYEILKNLGLANNIQLELNSLGDRESREAHRESLVSYLTPLKASLSADSQIRLEKNPLRILDSKDEGDQGIVKEAPKLVEFMNEHSKDFFKKVQEGLQQLEIPFTINPSLVRGLDYYTHSVFEFVTRDLGSQGAVLSGGRYDGLIETLGGPATPGVGWGAGIERLMLLLEQLHPSVAENKLFKIAVLAADERAEVPAFKIGNELRRNSFSSEIFVDGNMSKKMKKANKFGAHFCVILGTSEMEAKQVTLKNMSSGEQTTISELELIAELRKAKT